MTTCSFLTTNDISSVVAIPLTVIVQNGWMT